jgi:DNA-binding XRE family transcriptional regulator
MPRKVLRRIRAIAPAEGAFTLHVQWDDGDASLVDVSGQIETFRVYAPLRREPDLFRKVSLGEHGTDIVWPGDIDMAADTLWRLAQEQSGATMSADAFRSWRQRHAYTLDEAAKALGISRRMVAYYDHGEKPIPRVVALAARALESSNQ